MLGRNDQSSARGGYGQRFAKRLLDRVLQERSLVVIQVFLTFDQHEQLGKGVLSHR